MQRGWEIAESINFKWWWLSEKAELSTFIWLNAVYQNTIRQDQNEGKNHGIYQ